MVIPVHIHKSLMLSWGKGALGEGDSPKGWIEGLNGLFVFHMSEPEKYLKLI